MRTIARFIGLLLAGSLTFQQGFGQTIKGTLSDSAGRTVPYATINLRYREQKIIVAYTMSDSAGRYSLRAPTGATAAEFEVEVRCIGYKDQTRAIIAFPSIIDFTLAVSANELPSVVVTNKRPVLRTSGDTLSYKVSDFSNEQDRVIGDVIKKLPGISVSSDGTIYYNNKPISGVYIGGDNLLDDKYTIGTNSIPQNIVDQVQVIENHQPIRMLQNKVTSNDVALNLALKKSAPLHVLGQEIFGAGLPGNYEVNINAMLFKDQFKAINYLKGDNTGYDLQQELISHNASDNLQRIGNDPPSALLSLGAVNNPAIARSRYLFDQSGMLSLNNLLHFGNDWQVRMNAWYLHDWQKQDYSQSTRIFLPGDTVQFTDIQHNRFTPEILHAQVVLNLNSKKCYLNDVLLTDNTRWADYSGLNANGSQLGQKFRDNLLNFSNELNWMASTKSGNILQVYSYLSHQAEPESLTIGPGYNDSLFNKGQPYALLMQNANVPTWFTNNHFSFSFPGDVLTKSFEGGFTVQSETLRSNLSLMQSNNTVLAASDSSANALSWLKKRIYGEGVFDIRGQKLKANLILPLIFQQLNYSDPGYGLNNGFTRIYFNPHLIAKYNVSLENFLTFRYSYLNQTGSIEDIYQGSILKDYRTLNANSADLTLRQSHSAAIGFNYRKAVQIFFWNLNLLYEYHAANNIASSVITNSFQRLIMLPFPNDYSSRTIDGTISKYSFALGTTFSGEMKWQNSGSVQLQNGAFLPFNLTAETMILGVETKLSDKLMLSYHVTGTQTASHSAAEVSVNRLDQLQQQATVYYNPADDLQFKISGEHYVTRSQGNPDLVYFFGDASAKYRFKKRNIDLQLEASNFLNVKTYRALYLTANTLTSGSYTLPGRILLLKVMFNL